jgi:hypothetical protein
MAARKGKPKGRPSGYSQEIAGLICEKLSEGVPLSHICSEDWAPSYTTAKRWQRENEEFRSLSARAREDGTHFLADDCLRIADDDQIDPARQRIRIDTRLRLIGKWNSRAYGDKVDLNLGGQPDNPVVLDASKLSAGTLKEMMDASRSKPDEG